jgi:hypothetical protein
MLWGIFRGIRLLAICFLGVMLLLGGPMPVPASVPPNDRGSQTYLLPICPPKTSFELHLSDPKEAEPAVTFSLGDRLPVVSPGQNLGAGLSTDTVDKNSRQMTAKFQFTPSAELRVSFLYNQDQPSGHSPIGPASHVLFRYSLDYCIMPTLKVGLTGYLYKPPTDYFAWRNSLNFNDPIYGIGPTVRYDLGRWSFLLRSQLETGTKDRGEALHNWFRVWYAF